MTDDPAAFRDVRCLVGAQPVTMKIIVEQRLTLAGVEADCINDL